MGEGAAVSTAGQTIIGLSGLSGVSAGAHLMAITAGASAGPSGFASRMTVTTTTARMSVTERPRKQAQSVAPKKEQTGTAKSTSKTAYVCTPTERYQVLTGPDEIWVRMNKETI